MFTCMYCLKKNGKIIKTQLKLVNLVKHIKISLKENKPVYKKFSDDQVEIFLTFVYLLYVMGTSDFLKI